MSKELDVRQFNGIAYVPMPTEVAEFVIEAAKQEQAKFKEKIANGKIPCPCTTQSPCAFSHKELGCMIEAGSLKATYSKIVKSSSVILLGMIFERFGACARNNRKIQKLILRYKPAHVTFGECSQEGVNLDGYISTEVIFYKR